MALNLREGDIIRTRDCVNKVIPGRTDAEWRYDNREEAKQYRQTHKEAIATRGKQYRQTTKNIRKCSCGVEFNDGHTSHRNKHYNSKFHIEFVDDFYERLHKLLVPAE